jgi:hypothetical protein
MKLKVILFLVLTLATIVSCERNTFELAETPKEPVAEIKSDHKLERNTPGDSVK